MIYFVMRTRANFSDDFRLPNFQSAHSVLMTGKHLYIISQGWQLKKMFTSAQPRGMNIRWNPFLYLSVLLFSTFGWSSGYILQSQKLSFLATQSILVWFGMAFADCDCCQTPPLLLSFSACFPTILEGWKMDLFNSHCK